ncbi:MAG: M15 family metallopeptidase [Acaryochloridaceae cyanobacterium RU_4_10]|nr:M15 family metallopeptidase [Acaryochloridaceae cyanobacterium RU_4_10]
MKFLRSLSDRWPFIALSLATTAIVLWAGLIVRSVFEPQTAIQTNVSSSAGPSSTPLPSWIKTAPPLVAPLPQQSVPTLAPTATPTAPAAKSPPPKVQPSAISRNSLPQARYGHLPYAEHLPENLVSIGTYGQGSNQRTESLDKEAAAAFEQMVADAKASGVRIIPISGFRTITDQEKLFERQIKRQGSPEAASRLSAPAGYSEHHTGYALDVGDGNHPEKDLKFEFEETAAYKWMVDRAQTYGFELSFPNNNVQGVSFEPWHWRYVKSGRAAAIFSVAHALQGGSASGNAAMDDLQ